MGDSCHDIYHYGEVNRISPEAPIPILDLLYEEGKPGMASNVYTNLINLGASATLKTKFFEIKHRYIDIKTKRQLLRVDEKITDQSPQYNNMDCDFDGYDAIVISDYDKGFLSCPDLLKIQEKFKGPIFIDSKKRNLSKFSNMIIKINQHEFEKSDLIDNAINVVVTYGSEKVIFENEVYYPNKIESYDPCGAGDTFLAALAIRYLETKDMGMAIKFAMRASEITVKHVGVYAPTIEEVLNET